MKPLKREESVNALTHLAGALLAPFGAALLILRSGRTAGEVVSLIVYGLSVTLLFSASALYHYNKKKENEKSLWRTLDHISIFFMIAGTYTPFCVLVLKGTWGIVILSVQWGLVALGLVLKLIWLRSPRWLTTGIYLAMGWVALGALKPLYDRSSLTMLLLMLGGGVTYSAGAVIYALKKPNPVPGFFGFHEIFHVFILAATALLYGAVWTVVAV